MNTETYISVDPEICHGKPCFKGSRIILSIVLELLEAGQTVNQIIEAYPKLTPSHVQAALHFASQVLDNEHHIHFPPAA